MTPYVILLITILSFILNYHAANRLSVIAKKSLHSSFSGEEIAEKILQKFNQPHVKIRKSNHIGENLYDPLIKVIQFGPEVFGCRTIYSMAVGCHEACHALKFQYFRFLFVPLTFIIKYIFLPLFILAFFIQAPFLHYAVLLMYIALLIMKFLIEVLDEIRINRLSIKILSQCKHVSVPEMNETKKIYRFFNYTYFASLPLKVLIQR